MIRSFLYILVLLVIIFTPISFIQKTEEQAFKRTTKSINIKLVEPKPLVKKLETPKVLEPKPKTKKVIKKKIIKKKIVKKKVIPKEKVIKKALPKPKEESVKVQEKSIQAVKEEPIVEEVIQEQIVPISSSSQVDEYYAQIYEEINKNKYYPKKSQRFKQEDTIPVFFIIDKNGHVSAFEIIKKSKYRELNKAIKKMFKKMKKFKKPPSGVQTPLEMSIEINFKLQR